MKTNDEYDKEFALRGYECPYCKDTHMKYPDCETCDGNGWVDDPDDGGTMCCPECDGEECYYCQEEDADIYEVNRKYDK